MTNVIDLNSRRPQDLPDACHMITDPHGTVWHGFMCSYTDSNGVSMGFNIWAISADDAESRLKSIRENAQVDGQIYATISE